MFKGKADFNINAKMLNRISDNECPNAHWDDRQMSRDVLILLFAFSDASTDTAAM